MVTTGIANIFKWAAPDWIAAYSYPNGFKHAKGGGFNAWEPVLIYGKNPLKIDHKHFFGASEKVIGHPCPKPLKPFQWLITESSTCGQTILDPFMGSGTTLVAAKQLNRKCIGIELEKKYCEIAAKRLRQEVFNFAEVSA